MRNVSLLLCLSVCVTSCGPISFWHRDGVTYSTLTREITGCEVEGAQKVPVDRRVEREPFYRTPIETICEPTASGGEHCRTIGGELRGGEVYTYDANEGLRRRVVTQCLTDRGYQKVTLPRCTQEQRARTRVINTQQAAINPESCAARADGLWLPVTPG